MNKFENKNLLILKNALGAESDLHIVGGYVRDIILNKSPKDMDLACVYTPNQIEEKLKAANVPYVITGIRRGTITAVIENDPIEITTFRNPANEKEYTQSILEDLPARDFSINAIAWNVFSNSLVDPYNGINDLRNNILKCVRDPEIRFTEDPHRILRMVRFGPAQNRKVDSETYAAAIKHVKLLCGISIERIHDELVKILLAENIIDAFSIMRTMGIIDLFIPELTLTYDYEQNHYHECDLFNHIIKCVAYTLPDKIERFAALFHDIGKPACLSIDERGIRHFYSHAEKSAEITKEILERLRFSNDDIERIVKLVRHHDFSWEIQKPGLRRLLRKFGDDIDKLIGLKFADGMAGHTKFDCCAIDNIQKQLDEIRNTQEENFLSLDINGNDIIDLGFKQGKIIGKILNALTEKVMDDPALNNKESLLELAKHFKLETGI